MVDSDSQTDQGGNPLGEGTIMGSDGEVPFQTGSRGRDNYMHGSVDPLVALAAGWMGDDPLEQGKLRCPNCGNDVMADREGKDLFCVGCDKSWPVAGEGGDWNQEYRDEMNHTPADYGFLGPVHQGSMEDVLGLPAQPQTSMMRWEPGMHGRGLVIGGEPHTWNAYDPQRFQSATDLGPMHEEYVKGLGIDPNLADWGTGVEILPNGEVQQGPGRDATPYIQSDPRLKAQENTYQFSYIMPPTSSFRTLNTEPYEELWAHEADVLFDKGPDANVPPVTFTAQPSPDLGIHNAHHKHLSFLDAHVGGVSARNDWNTIFNRFGMRNSPEFGQPVQVSVHDAAHIVPLKAQLEQPYSSTTPEFGGLVGKIASGELPPPPGVDPSTINYTPPEQTPPTLAKTALALLPEAVGGLMDSGIGGALMKGALFRSGENFVGGGNGGQHGGPEVAQEEPNMALAALVMSDYETPMSLPDVGSKPDDPEKVDPKEFNDQDHGTNPVNPNMEDSGLSGEDAVRQEQGFAPDSPGMERLHMMLPLIQHYFVSGDAGEEDPMLRSLHETLESENPGYLDKVTPEDEQRAAEFLKQHGQEKPHGVHAKTALVLGMAPLGGDPNAVNQMIQNQVEPQGNVPVQPGAMQQSSQCPNCGGVLNGAGACPQCGAGALPAGNPQMPMPGGMPQGFASMDPLMALVAANHQGPVTPEQIAAVQQLLIKENRIDEIPNVPLHPENYVREMAEIQNQPNVAPQVSPQEQTQPPAPQMAPPGGMPVPGMGGGEPGGQPMQPMSTVLAADNVARKCPNCGSHTTGVANGDKGICFCHACGHEWSAPLMEDKVGRFAAEVPNPIATPAAERSNQPNPEAEQDSSLTWKDTDGVRLQPGKEYELENPKYEMPDMVRVDRVKPDGLEVTLVGTYANDPNSLQAPVTITSEEMKLQGITFKPAGQEQAPENNEPPPGTAAPGETPRPQTTDEHDNSFPNTSSVIEDPTEPDRCPKCSRNIITSSISGPNTIMHECFACAHAWETPDHMPDIEEGAVDREWIRSESSSGDDFFAGMERAQAMAAAGMAGQSRNIADVAARDGRKQQISEYLESEKVARAERTAGRHFSPQEQKDLIDEDGMARNSDLLNLTGTHYKHSGEAGMVDPDRVPDSHVLFGL